MQIKYETGYIPRLDKTIIFKYEMKENEVLEIICGWYYGEPDEEATEIFKKAGVVAHHDKEVFDDETWEAIGK